MLFINRTYEDFVKHIKGKKIVHFGASSAWHYFLKVFPEIGRDVLDATAFIVDNDPARQDSKFKISCRCFDVKNPQALNDISNYVILITVSLAYQESICKQLQLLALPDEIECYSLPLMTYSDKPADNSCVSKYFAERKTRKIPAKIHSLWFSGEEKPELYQKCVESWKRFCPAFEIIEWNAENYDISQHQYMREAFENRKWAFVSDYARLDVIAKYGGIYLDMDVELLGSLEQYLCADGFFCRQEDGLIELGSGFGAGPNDEIICALLKTYEHRKYILADGTFDKVAQPEWLSTFLESYGFGRGHDSEVIGSRIVLSNEYILCYSGDDLYKNAKLGIHWHNAGWLSDGERRLRAESLNARQSLIDEWPFRLGDTRFAAGVRSEAGNKFSESAKVNYGEKING